MNKDNIKTFFIFATNIHQGGGRTLLLKTLQSLPKDIQINIFVDTRMILPNNIAKNVNFEIVRPTVFQRLHAEWRLSKLAKAQDVILCFGSLPPFFKNKAYTFVFVQNRYLVSSASLSGFSFKTRARLAIERLWFSFNFTHAQSFVVQTPSMKSLVENYLQSSSVLVNMYPFVDENGTYLRKNLTTLKKSNVLYDFVYVASGEPHKNHHRLIEAWILLSKAGHFPKLALTLDQNQSEDLCQWVEQEKNNHQLKIYNLGALPHLQIKSLYDKSAALIFPSTLESFGIPLIEARQAGLQVLASELDYVRDILDPEQTFNPYSSISIADAVKRFLQIEKPALPLIQAAEFLQHIIGQAR